MISTTSIFFQNHPGTKHFYGDFCPAFPRILSVCRIPPYQKGMQSILVSYQRNIPFYTEMTSLLSSHVLSHSTSYKQSLSGFLFLLTSIFYVYVFYLQRESPCNAVQKWQTKRQHVKYPLHFSNLHFFFPNPIEIFIKIEEWFSFLNMIKYLLFFPYNYFHHNTPWHCSIIVYRVISSVLFLCLHTFILSMFDSFQ